MESLVLRRVPFPEFATSPQLVSQMHDEPVKLGRVHETVDQLHVVDAERRGVRLRGLDLALGYGSRITDVVPKKGPSEACREAYRLDFCVVKRHFSDDVEITVRPGDFWAREQVAHGGERSDGVGSVGPRLELPTAIRVTVRRAALGRRRIGRDGQLGPKRPVVGRDWSTVKQRCAGIVAVARPGGAR